MRRNATEGRRSTTGSLERATLHHHSLSTALISSPRRTPSSISQNPQCHSSSSSSPLSFLPIYDTSSIIGLKDVHGSTSYGSIPIFVQRLSKIDVLLFSFLFVCPLSFPSYSHSSPQRSQSKKQEAFEEQLKFSKSLSLSLSLEKKTRTLNQPLVSFVNYRESFPFVG